MKHIVRTKKFKLKSKFINYCWKIDSKFQEDLNSDIKV